MVKKLAKAEARMTAEDLFSKWPMMGPARSARRPMAR